MTLYVSLALLEICWPLLDAALVAANVGKVRVKTSIRVFSQDIMPLHSVQNDAEVGRGNRFCFCFLRSLPSVTILIQKKLIDKRKLDF